MLDETVKSILGNAVAVFSASAEPSAIRSSSQALSDLLSRWAAADKQVRQTIGTMLMTVRANCKHAGAQTGYNDRDGSWMAPCPTCGESR
jgi:hypothetical protein